MDNKDFEAQLLAGSTPTSSDGSKKLMVDLLHERFGAGALVKIKNFTRKKTGWVYSDRTPVDSGGTFRIEQPNEFTRRVWQGEQKVRVLEPGKTVIVPGWEAYVGLVRFFKQWVGDEYPDQMGVKMNSPVAQEEFISKAYLGIYDPNEPEEEKNVKEEVEKDLGLTKDPDLGKTSDSQKKSSEKDLGLVDEKPKAK